MPLKFKHIDEKLEIDKEGEKIVDLTTRSYLQIEDFDYGNRYIIDTNLVMRPDLLASETGSDLDFTNLLKTNIISNPFTLDVDDIILLRRSGGSPYVAPVVEDSETEEDVRSFYVNPDKVSNPDPKIQKIQRKFEELQRMGADTTLPSKSNLPPNFNEFGEGEVEIIGNKVRFAPGVSRNSSECSTEPISKASLISQVLKNKLNS
jgi:hypothetical protein